MDVQSLLESAKYPYLMVVHIPSPSIKEMVVSQEQNQSQKQPRFFFPSLEFYDYKFLLHVTPIPRSPNGNHSISDSNKSKGFRKFIMQNENKQQNKLFEEVF